MNVEVKMIKEEVVEGKRLGRHVEHDPLSREYGVEILTPISQLVAVQHRRYGSVFNQGDLGSCTGNAAAGAINTVPLRKVGHNLLKEKDAVTFYELATKLDDIQGSYPPDDTGSSGLAVAKAVKQLGFISSYYHAFGVEAALSALQTTSVITGVNWYEGFDNPDANGLVKIEGQVRGGHEFEVFGFEPATNPDEGLVECWNSWGHSWGVGGRFKFTVAIWRQLLSEQGDVTVLSR